MKSKNFTNMDDVRPTLKKEEKYIEFDAGSVARKSMLAGVVVVGIGGATVGSLMGLNNFFNKNYLEFRSPFIIQAPIVLHQRDSNTASVSAVPLNLTVQASELVAALRQHLSLNWY